MLIRKDTNNFIFLISSMNLQNWSHKPYFPFINYISSGNNSVPILKFHYICWQSTKTNAKDSVISTYFSSKTCSKVDKLSEIPRTNGFQVLLSVILFTRSEPIDTCTKISWNKILQKQYIALTICCTPWHFQPFTFL